MKRFEALDLWLRALVAAVAVPPEQTIDMCARAQMELC